MDVQMPEMDGLEATGGSAPSSAQPMSASDRRDDRARDGGRSRALPAGGNGRLRHEARRAQRLIEAVERAASAPRPTLASDRSSRAATAAAGPRATPPTATRVVKDPRLYRELLQVFLADLPGMLGRIRSALEAKDSTALRHAAHALKGSVANFEATQPFELARTLERIGIDDDLADPLVSAAAASLLHELEIALDDLKDPTPSQESHAMGDSIEDRSARKTVLVVDDDQVTRHLLKSVLTTAGLRGHDRERRPPGPPARARLGRARSDPARRVDARMTGLEVLAQLRSDACTPGRRHDLRRHARDHAVRPARRGAPLRVEADRHRGARRDRGKTLAAGGVADIEVVSARPEWVELVVPCTREAASRIEAFLTHLDADLTPPVRESVGYAFRELLLNAIEWGGKLDPERRVRVAYLRAKRFLLYRIADPGAGFEMEGLTHAAIANPGDPMAHMKVREEKGLRPGGFGLLLVQAKVDELLYNEARNEVVFVKYLETP
jgi:HPt (histidine-containing phosphotransfer) domain-containing protein/anti-sigma regulatory factor (Ser/Thr protein kinase)